METSHICYTFLSGEPAQIDHLVFVVHGIGPIADLNFRNIIECGEYSKAIHIHLYQEHNTTFL